MKRAIAYLSGAAATIILLLLARLTDVVPGGRTKSWQPYQGLTQGYLLELSADTLMTSESTGAPVRIITSDMLINAATDAALCDVGAPRLRSGSALLDGGWQLAWSRLRQCAPTVCNITMSPEGVDASRALRYLDSIMSSPDMSSWPSLDHKRPQMIIAAASLASNSDVAPETLRRLADASRQILATDSARLHDPESGLWRGGGDGVLSGALPMWMDDAERYAVESLAANALVCNAYAALASLLDAAGLDGASAAAGNARSIATAINNRLWMPTEGFYSQYLYGRHRLIRGPSGSGAGNALAAASPLVTNTEMTRRVVNNLPRTPYGIVKSFPLTDGTNDYTSPVRDQGWWALACGRAADNTALWNAISVLIREVSLAAVATGDDMTDNDVWGTFCGAVSRVIFGLTPTSSGLELRPAVPEELGGDISLTGFPYRNATLDIHITGAGARVASCRLDGNELATRIIPDTLGGNHRVDIDMVGATFEEKISPAIVIPELLAPTPEITWNNGTLTVDMQDGIDRYAFLVNDERYEDIAPDTPVRLPLRVGFTEYIVIPLTSEGHAAGYCAPPRSVSQRGSAVTLQAEWFAARALARDIYRRLYRRWFRLHARGRMSATQRPNRSLTQLVEITSNESITFTVEAPAEGRCVIELGYADGRDAGAAGIPLRSIAVNGQRITNLAMPRKGIPSDSTVTRTTLPVTARLLKGLNRIDIYSSEADKRPDNRSDTVMLDFIRITSLQ